MVLDSFIKRSVTGGLGSIQAEIMADTAVALTSANVQLVSRKVIGRLCRVGTCTETLLILFCLIELNIIHIPKSVGLQVFCTWFQCHY